MIIVASILCFTLMVKAHEICQTNPKTITFLIEGVANSTAVLGHFKSCTYILFTDLESSASGISTVWPSNILNSDVHMLALWFLTIDYWLVHWAGWFPFFTVVCICLDSVLLVSRFLKWIHCAKFNILLLVASAVHAHN